MKILRVGFYGFLLILFCYAFAYQYNNHLYSTWNNLEVDKCAAAWLLLKFVDSRAIFRFYPEGELIKAGIPFDTPDSRFRRTHNRTSFEAVADIFKISDPKVTKMADIIRDIELNIWGRKKYRVSNEINLKINAIIKNSSSPEEALINSYKIFDSLFDELEAGKYGKQATN
jgi:hypothetical protein